MTESALRLVYGAAHAADTVRVWWLRLLAPWAAGWMRDRTSRVLAMGVSGIVVSLTISSAALLPMLVLSPLLLGLPHLVADLRYVLLREGLTGRLEWQLGVLPLLVLSLVPGLQSVGWAAVGVAAAGQGWRTGALLPWLAAGVSAVLMLPKLAAGVLLVFLWAHNVLALWAWWRWRPRPVAQLWIPMLFVASVLALLAGALDALLLRGIAQFPQVGDVTLMRFLWMLPPVSLEPVLVARLLAVFGFTQSVHYLVWLRLIPEDARPRSGTRSFRASLDALLQEVGRVPLLLAGALWLLVLVRALWSTGSAMDLYFRLAWFHGFLELAWLLSGRARSHQNSP